MTVYFIWDKTVDTDVRNLYLEIVYEEIGGSPEENLECTKYLVGSSRLTLNKINRLKKYAENKGFLDKIAFNEDEKPLDWHEKPPENIENG